ncbi:MAG: hypothetical protein KY460_03520 [Actinobacteria bacterium]|nr:hypothetical protein [Actinomycetota bacterium]
MRFAYKELPGDDGDFLRPVVAVGLAGQESLSHACLIDSGALHNRFALWTAETAGVPLDEGIRTRIAVGGIICEAVTVPVELRIGDVDWHAAVSFCDPWPFGFNLLGQEGFFRFFEATFQASRYSFELQPDHGRSHP